MYKSLTPHLAFVVVQAAASENKILFFFVCLSCQTLKWVSQWTNLWSSPSWSKKSNEELVCRLSCLCSWLLHMCVYCLFIVYNTQSARINMTAVHFCTLYASPTFSLMEKLQGKSFPWPGVFSIGQTAATARLTQTLSQPECE